MKVIIAVNRSLTDPQHIVDAVEASGFAIAEVVSGCMFGMDEMGERWARRRGIHVESFPADWGDLTTRKLSSERGSTARNTMQPRGQPK